MHLIVLLSFLFAALVTADFWVSNATVCTGGFILESCVSVVQILSASNNPNTTYGCSHVMPAQDNNYLWNGTAGPNGTAEILSSGGICGKKNLRFEREDGYEGEDYRYKVHDATGNVVGECKHDDSTLQPCNFWLGVTYFQTELKCTGTLCA